MNREYLLNLARRLLLVKKILGTLIAALIVGGLLGGALQSILLVGLKPRLVHVLNGTPPYTCSLISFSHDGRFVIGLTRHMFGPSEYFVWNLQSGQLVTSVGALPLGEAMLLLPSTLVYTEYEKDSLELFEKGKIPIQSVERSLILHDVCTKEEHPAPVRLELSTKWQLSPDGNLLAAQDSQGYVGLWEMLTGKRRGLVMDEVPTGSARDIRFSPLGDALGAAYSDGTICLWTATTGEKTVHIKLPEKRLPLDCSLSPDLTRVIAMWSPPRVDPITGTQIDYEDEPELHTCRVWDIIDQDRVPKLQYGALAVPTWFLPEGKLVSSEQGPRRSWWPPWLLFKKPTGSDLVIRDLDNREVVARIPDCQDGIISPDERQFVGMGKNGILEHWSLPANPPIWPAISLATVASLITAVVAWRFTGRRQAA